MASHYYTVHNLRRQFDLICNSDALNFASVVPLFASRVYNSTQQCAICGCVFLGCSTFFNKLPRSTWTRTTIYKFPDRPLMLFDYSAHSNYPMRACMFVAAHTHALLMNSTRKDDKLLAFHLVITLSCNVCLIILLACFLFYCNTGRQVNKADVRLPADAAAA